MERIKQAIEKARQQTGQHSTPVPPPPVAASVTNQGPEIGEIRYSHTQVVKLDPEHLERNRIVAYNKSSTMGWAFDLLRTQVLQKMDENGWRTLAIVSPTPEAGKTMVAINLAMSIAHHTSKSALLVDFDLRRPKIGSYLGLPMAKSLNDLLEGQAEMQDILVNLGLPRLVVLPTKKPVPHSSETLSSGKIHNLITEMRDRYDSRIVIFDLPPLLNSDDAISVLPKMDCVLMVVGNGMSTRQEIEDSMRHLSEDRLVGTVLNKAEVDRKVYYYGEAAS